MTRKLTVFSFCLLLAIAAATWAAEEGTDPFKELLFSPELIMQHQTSISLSDEQRRELITEITAAQGDLLPYQMEMAGFGEQLQRLLAERPVDEDSAVGIATRVMELETLVKRRHLRLAIRIKNLLTAEQQEKLAELR